MSLYTHTVNTWKIFHSFASVIRTLGKLPSSPCIQLCLWSYLWLTWACPLLASTLIRKWANACKALWVLTGTMAYVNMREGLMGWLNGNERRKRTVHDWTFANSLSQDLTLIATWEFTLCVRKHQLWKELYGKRGGRCASTSPVEIIWPSSSWDLTWPPTHFFFFCTCQYILIGWGANPNIRWPCQAGIEWDPSSSEVCVVIFILEAGSDRV